MRDTIRQGPLVSVIMPLYNKRPYVRRAVESVLHQTYKNWELIIVDDGSSDGSIEEIPTDDQRIRVFRQENMGPGAARNRGINMTSGDFVTFIDADDYYYPNKLEREMVILTEGKADWMISAYELEGDNEIKNHYVRDARGNKIENEACIYDDTPNQLDLRGIPPHSICIRKDMLLKVGGFNENMRCYEIYDFVLRCALNQPRVLVDPQLLYRIVRVPDSAFTVSSDRIEGMKQLGLGLYELSISHPSYAELLIDMSKRNFFSCAAHLILSSKNAEARRFLTKHFPFKWNRRWWKMWFGSWIPSTILQRLFKM